MRKPRVLLEGGRYHVSARANHRELLLEPAEAKELFLATVARAMLKYDFELHNLVLMGNHFHFLIRTGPGTSLSLVMKWILGTFAMAWNRLHGSWGHFWGDRFHSRLISSPAAYLKTFLYLDDNPVRAGLCAKPDEWSWGRFGRPGRLLSRDPDLPWGQT